MKTSMTWPSPAGQGPVAAIGHWLETGGDVTRSAAARALGALDDPAAAPLLIDALLDVDPDVRTDAMAALAPIARVEDAPTIRGSLDGDPIKDVKIAAIEALAQLRDPEAVPRLRRLARERAEDIVAWEDELEVWDDWLDVQIKAIEALGRMNAAAAIDDLLAARADAFGQELDHDVFRALGRITDGGAAALLPFVRAADERIRARALEAFARTAPDLSARLVQSIAGDASAEVRRLAIASLRADDPLAWRLARDDEDASVRAAAVTAFAGDAPELARAALADPDEEVRAATVRHLRPAADDDDLRANLSAWMRVAGPSLAAAAADKLGELGGAAAMEPLRGLAGDATRPLEARIAALRALGAQAGEGIVETLLGSLADPVRQVRTAALVALAERAKAGDETAVQALAAAISGRSAAERDGGADDVVPGAAPTTSIPATDTDQWLRITAAGEIVAVTAMLTDTDATASVGPLSTLDAIQGASRTIGEGEDTGRKRQGRRVPIEGPVEFGVDLRLVALRVAADLDAMSIMDAVVEAGSAGAPIRAIALETLARFAARGPLPPSAVWAATTALGDGDPAVRGFAAAALARGTADAAERLTSSLDDADAQVRLWAVRAVTRAVPDRALAAMRDTSRQVREAAFEALVDLGDDELLVRALETCSAGRSSDTLASACERSAVARHWLVRGLCDVTRHESEVRVLLEALAAVRRPAMTP